MSVLTAALLSELSERDLDQLAELLGPRLAARLGQGGNGDGWLRGAEAIAVYIDSPVSRVYAFTSAGRIPVERDGSALIARKSELDDWLRSGGARRP